MDADATGALAADDPSLPGEAVSPSVRRVLAPNPGPMTLDGTNSYVLRAPGAPAAVVVDPGPLDEGHLAALAGLGPVGLVLLTHHHADHSESLAAFATMTGAPVRAIDPDRCIGGEPLADGTRIRAGGLDLEILATPGHTADSMCVAVVDPVDGTSAVLTGDTILGRGTTIIADPDGALGPYLASLERLRDLGGDDPVRVLPGHGPVVADLRALCVAYLAHRAERLDQVRDALARLGADATAEQVADLVYGDVDAAVRYAAEASVRAQLAYLRS
ncbi:MBL fold metallo-hydrolase [Agromyces sp. MMS24-JH15]|uniref:MBL fold metallo-hydrolase n=1 Tax=Agromyces sp. MMS24-JH15 TaxID=3243765 RepID=UPI003748E4BE